MSWDMQGGQAAWPMTNVRNLKLPQWRRLVGWPQVRCLIPLTEVCEWTLGMHNLGGGKLPLNGEMWFAFTNQPTFAVAGFWQHLIGGPA